MTGEMHLRITGDIALESGVDEVIYDLSGPTRKHFAVREYGTDLIGLVIVLMCQDPSLHLKRRIRFSKKDKTLYMDIMLDLEEMKRFNANKRREIILEKLQTEVPEVLARYSFKDFEKQRFVNDLKEWLTLR